MNEPLHQASILLAPPDTCPNCGHEHALPYDTTADWKFAGGENNLIGYYYCTVCNFTWDTRWRIDTLP